MEQFFHLTERGTSVRQEVLAGITTFLMFWRSNRRPS